jgi:hydrogenase/urease accessory protein HupE
VHWKVPALGDLRLALHPRFPSGGVETAHESAFLADSYVERWQLQLPGGLAGKEISVDGLAGIQTDVLLRVETLDGASQTARLTPANPSYTIAAVQSAFDVARSYFGLGVEHILLGIDHLLFVLGLLLLLDGWRQIALTVTAFTVAHSITLALATFGVVHVPDPLVNILIALSILFLAVEVARARLGERGLTSRKPWLIAFGFGLLHGLGFASGLAALGLPPGDIPLALLSFNLGVEAGQLAFVLIVLLLRRCFEVLQFRWNPVAAAVPCYAIGISGAYWTLDRILPLVTERLG